MVRPITVPPCIQGRVTTIQPQLAWSQQQARISVLVNGTRSILAPYYPGNRTPDPATIDLIKGLKQGDEVIVNLAVNANKVVATSIKLVSKEQVANPPKQETRTVAPEDEPGVYVFKSYEPGTLVVTKKDREGKPQELTLQVGKKSPYAARLAACKEGDLLYLNMENDTGRHYLTLCEPYQPPVKGEFLKAERKNDGKSKDLLVQIKTDAGVSDFTCPAGSKLLTTFTALRAGHPVFFRASKDDSKTLYFFEPAEKKT